MKRRKRKNPVIASYKSSVLAYRARKKLMESGLKSPEVIRSADKKSHWLWVWDTELDRAQNILGVGRSKNPRRGGRYVDVPTKHQIKIAKQTLKYSDVGARIMGGMTKEEARDVLLRHGIRFKENPCRRNRHRRRKGRNHQHDKHLVARFEAKGKKRWLELYKDDLGYTYATDGGGGSLGRGIYTDQDAINLLLKGTLGAMKADHPSTRRVKNPCRCRRKSKRNPRRRKVGGRSMEKHRKLMKRLRRGWHKIRRSTLKQRKLERRSRR